MKNLLLKFWLLVFLLSFSFSLSNACECGELKTPTCAHYWRAEYVFVAKVKYLSAKPDADGNYPYNTKAHLQIEEVFRGKIKGEVISKRGNGADCLPEYQKGARYLIFGYDYNSNTKTINTNVCAGNSLLDDEDGNNYLASVRALQMQKSEPLVLGRIINEQTYMPLSNIKVLLKSNEQIHETRTNDEGNFSISLKQQGKFNVKVFFPFDALFRGYQTITDIISTPNETIFEYEENLPPRQCHYNQILVTKVIEE